MAPASHALVVAAGDVELALLATLADPATATPADPATEAAAAPVTIIAADGGAAHVLEAGLVPDVVAGDFDSLSAAERDRLESMGVELRVARADKDESDMELCLLAALEAGATRITIVGALGLVRPEHSVANLLLLADQRLDGLDVAIVGRGSRITRSGTADGPGQAELEGEPGDFISLFGLGEAVEGVTTSGLRFPLADETLPLGPSRGLSNELLDRRARVTSRRGRLLVIHSRRSTADAPATGGS